MDLATNGGQAGVAGDLTVGNGAWALNLGGSARRSGNYDTPEGEVDNTQTRGAFANVGLARTTQDSYLGGGVQIDDTKYGVPVIEGGEIQLTPRRQVYSGRGEFRNLDGFFTSARGSVAYHRYRHEELEGDEVGTEFRNDLLDLDFRATHRRGRPHDGHGRHVGLRAQLRSRRRRGALAPGGPGRVLGVHLPGSSPGRTPRCSSAGATTTPATRPKAACVPRQFNNVSFSVGSLLRPSEQSTIALSFARAARNPALEELYFFGLHAGNFSFEIGNDDLDSEISYGLDVSYRVRLPRLSAEVTYFNNTVNNYIFRSPLSEEEFDERYPELEDDGHEGEGHQRRGVPDRRVRRRATSGSRAWRHMPTSTWSAVSTWSSGWTRCGASFATTASRCRAFRRCGSPGACGTTGTRCSSAPRW